MKAAAGTGRLAAQWRHSTYALGGAVQLADDQARELHNGVKSARTCAQRVLPGVAVDHDAAPCGALGIRLLVSTRRIFLPPSGATRAGAMLCCVHHHHIAAIIRARAGCHRVSCHSRGVCALLADEGICTALRSAHTPSCFACAAALKGIGRRQ